LDTLPPKIKKDIKDGVKDIPLDENRLSMYYYKKDDWRQWANPMIYAILDDIIMLEKMRLADMSALDGAISNIRLWTIGSLEHKILPNKSAINKLRDILASNVGGGTMELVWGPELSFQESSTDVHKFLGSEKYSSVLNSIYAGLGVPPTLTGMAGNGGGFTNNFISLKTLVERLQYGRDLLKKFWEKELELVRQAMGFRYKAHIQFDQMSLSDEATEKNLLIQLADRDIISHETLLERFKEIPQIEKIRMKRELKRRDAIGPQKAGPFHPPPVPELKEGSEKDGRPLFKQDDGPRKQRVESPKSKPGVAEMMVWAESAFDVISSSVNDAFLSSSGKKNLRQLTKAEINTLEHLKLDIFTNLKPMQKVDNTVVLSKLKSKERMPKSFAQSIKQNNVTIDIGLELFRKNIIGLYIESKIS